MVKEPRGIMGLLGYIARKINKSQAEAEKGGNR